MSSFIAGIEAMPACLPLARCAANEVMAKLQVLQWIHGVAAQLAEVPAPEIALQLYLQAAHAASEVARLELIAYEFFEQVCAAGSYIITAHLDCPALSVFCLLSTCTLLHQPPYFHQSSFGQCSTLP